jgi:hypothetical protein
MNIDDDTKASVVWSIKSIVGASAATTLSITVGHPYFPIPNNSDIR